MKRALVLVLGLLGCQGAPVNQAEQVDYGKLAEVNAELGMQYMQKGDYEIALEKFERALDADPRHVDALNGLGLLRARLGQNDKAEANFRRAIAIAPDNSAALNNYGQFLCLQGRHEDGQKQFLKAVENPLYKLPAVAYSNAGTCARAAGDLHKAETHFRAALEIDKRLPPALLQMAELSFELDRHLQARGYLQRFEDAVRRHTARTLWLGIRIERALGNRDAEASYALQLEKNFPDAKETQLLLESR